MKSFLLAVAGLLVFSTTQAQTKYEVGLNGGVSVNTIPKRAAYNGEKTVWNKAAGASFNKNLNERWQVGVNAGLTSWATTKNTIIIGNNGDSLNTENVKYVQAERAVSFAFHLNHVIPFVRAYDDFAWSKLYIGISAGGVATGGDGKITYSKVKANTPVEYTYASEFHFESGYGYLLGCQIGYTYYFGDHLGINLEIAPRVAWVKTVDPRYGNANNDFNLAYFPSTIGVHYRFGSLR